MSEKILKSNLKKLVNVIEKKILSKYELRQKTDKTINFYQNLDSNISIIEFFNKAMDKKIIFEIKIYNRSNNSKYVLFEYKEYDNFNETIKYDNLTKFSKYRIDYLDTFLLNSGLFKLK